MDPALVTPILEEYSWTRVFERVDQVYPTLVANRKNSQARPLTLAM